jgi:Protein of unknown function (DUF3570)
LRVQLISSTPGAAGALRLGLAAATAALLAPAHGQTGGAQPTGRGWQVDSAVLLYKEGGGRVSAVEPVISATRADGNDHVLGLKLTLDALTGASPNGAVAQPQAQTFTTPSGRSTYRTPASQMPLDPTFHDRRVALAASLDRPWGESQRLSLGAAGSGEHDFFSLSFNAGLARDFNDKNTTASLGLAFEANRIRPEGGLPAQLHADDGGIAPRDGAASRRGGELLAGLTQVMNRRWLMQWNLGLSRSTGHHADPYKIVSVIDGSTGLLVGDRYVTESRPDARSRSTLYWRNLVSLDRDVVDLSYRYYRDDWGVRAHTLDLRYRWELGTGGMHLEPHLRLYRQSAADFWQGWLVEGSQWSSGSHRAQVSHASADPRLAEFTGRTVGLKFGMPVGRGNEFTARLESYRQTQAKPGQVPGVLRQLDWAPDLKAVTMTLGYTHAF